MYSHAKHTESKNIKNVIYHSELIILSLFPYQVKAGIVMNVICILVLQLSMQTYTHAYLNLGEYPAWAISGGVLSENVNNETGQMTNGSVVM